MAAKLIEPTDLMIVNAVPLLIFGPPGSGKSSIAQTCDNPLTLDFDLGIHRSFNRKRSVQFETWADCVQFGESGGFAPYATLVIDTGGRALDTMIPGILKENVKNGYQGNLSPQGWGVLGGRFTTWMKVMRSMGKQLVMLCHEETEKNEATGRAQMKPDLPGKMSYKEIHKCFDLIGSIRFDGRNRLLDFNPSDERIGKNAAGWEPLPVPKLEQAPRFLAELIAEAKAKIGQAAAASAEVAKVVGVWAERIGQLKDMNELVAILPELQEAKLDKPVKAQVWTIIQQAAAAVGFTFDHKSQKFMPKGSAA